MIGKIFNWNNSQNNRFFRIFFLISFFVLCYLYVSVNILLTVISDDINKNKINVALPKERRDIVDRNGSLIVSNLPISSLFANPSKIQNPESAVSKLHSLFPSINKDKLLSDLKSNKKFVWIKRDLTPKQQTQIHNLGIAGIEFEHDLKRFYTQGNNFSHLLGYVDRDNNGIGGLERFLNDEILSNIKDPIQLSVDHRLQNIVSEELNYTINKFSAIGGVGIVVDATNGEILSMVSKPDFDPHSPTDSKQENIFNKASLGLFEIGSVFKAITFAAGLDSSIVSLNDVYKIDDLSISKFNIKDYHKKSGWTTVAQIFMNSSNIGSSIISLEIGSNRFSNYLKKFGLLDNLKIELSEKAHPSYPNMSKLNDISLVTMSYGYGMSITPLHFVQAMVPIVNGGYFYDLTLIKGKNDNKENKILKDTTSSDMNKLLRLTVEKGTGKKANVKGYLVGGKTGTANKTVKGKYSKDKRISSFVGVTPAINPKYIVFVLIDEPKGIKETFGFATAGYTAAPTVGNIISKMSSLYGMKPYDEDDDLIKEILHVDYEINHDI